MLRPGDVVRLADGSYTVGDAAGELTWRAAQVDGGVDGVLRLSKPARAAEPRLVRRAAAVTAAARRVAALPVLDAGVVAAPDGGRCILYFCRDLSARAAAPLSAALATGVRLSGSGLRCVARVVTSVCSALHAEGELYGPIGAADVEVGRGVIAVVPPSAEPPPGHPTGDLCEVGLLLTELGCDGLTGLDAADEWLCAGDSCSDRRELLGRAAAAALRAEQVLADAQAAEPPEEPEREAASVAAELQLPPTPASSVAPASSEANAVVWAAATEPETARLPACDRETQTETVAPTTGAAVPSGCPAVQCGGPTVQLDTTPPQPSPHRQPALLRQPPAPPPPPPIPPFPQHATPCPPASAGWAAVGASSGRYSPHSLQRSSPDPRSRRPLRTVLTPSAAALPLAVAPAALPSWPTPPNGAVFASSEPRPPLPGPPSPPAVPGRVGSVGSETVGSIMDTPGCCGKDTFVTIGDAPFTDSPPARQPPHVTVCAPPTAPPSPPSGAADERQLAAVATQGAAAAEETRLPSPVCGSTPEKPRRTPPRAPSSPPALRQQSVRTERQSPPPPPRAAQRPDPSVLRTSGGIAWTPTAAPGSRTQRDSALQQALRLKRRAEGLLQRQEKLAAGIGEERGYCQRR
eukprot:TRINITY_DN28131_c0_g1_i2.p1 TRINITY_DN28131_c0_g1~~TRINITY_DN28131_c0_g1_i2.p1  ORF type:complete len:647 (+),score=183.04 TRINITY_DN28131_c0_g1_i2:42-1943(+)